LTLREQRFIVSWVEGLGPRNSGEVFLNVLDPAAASRDDIEASPRFDLWILGEPDLTVPVPPTAPAMIGSDGFAQQVQRSVIDPEFDAETWVGALEYRPADRSATRAAVFTVEETGQWLATWTPWHGFQQLANNTAFRLDAGAKIVAEIHVGEPVRSIDDPGLFGIHVAAGAELAAPTDMVLVASGELPAGATHYRLRADAELATDTEVIALWPVLPSGIESIEVSARRPDGRAEVLLYALDMNRDWPTPYVYATPVELPSGTRLAVTAYVTNGSPESMTKQLELTVSAVVGEL
jgi:hypothetical protein